MLAFWGRGGKRRFRGTPGRFQEASDGPIWDGVPSLAFLDPSMSVVCLTDHGGLMCWHDRHSLARECHRSDSDWNASDIVIGMHFVTRGALL